LGTKLPDDGAEREGVRQWKKVIKVKIAEISGACGRKGEVWLCQQLFVKGELGFGAKIDVLPILRTIVRI
jgi:hypothetical protein